MPSNTMQINILSRKFIKPSNPTPNHLQTHKLSFFDQLAPPAHIPLVFFYPGTPENHDQRLQQLQKSLSEILTLFYPLAGRFVKEDLLVECNDQGVEFLEAKVNIHLVDFLNDGPKIELLNIFVPWDIGAATSITAPIVAVQATVFECGGLALCVHVSHIVGDGFTGSVFINSWAEASRLGIGKVACPDFILSSLFPSRDLSGVVQLQPPKKIEPNVEPPKKIEPIKIITRKFVFDAVTLSTLKAKAKAKPAGEVNHREPTRLEVVLATLWKALIQVTRAKNEGQLKPSLMSISVNLRGRTALPTPKKSFGNFFALSSAKFVAEESNLELNHLVGLIRGSIRNTLASCAKLSESDEIFSAVVNYFNEVKKSIFDEKVDVHNFTSMCGFNIYGTDFGWGEPSRVTNVAVPLEMIALMDTKCGTGIEGWVSLKETYMFELEKDPDIAGLALPQKSK